LWAPTLTPRSMEMMTGIQFALAGARCTEIWR